MIINRSISLFLCINKIMEGKLSWPFLKRKATNLEKYVISVSLTPLNFVLSFIYIENC